MKISSNGKNSTAVIYVPGLGDSYDIVRRIALWLWRYQKRNIRVHFVAMRWSDPSDTYESKVRRIAETISRIPASSRIVLIGESAGAAIVLANWLEDSRVGTIVTLAGKNRGRVSVGVATFRKNPSFREAMDDVEAVLPLSKRLSRSRVINVYSPYDTTVPLADATIPGAQKLVVKAPSHAATILTFLFWRFRRVFQLLQV